MRTIVSANLINSSIDSGAQVTLDFHYNVICADSITIKVHNDDKSGLFYCEPFDGT